MDCPLQGKRLFFPNRLGAGDKKGHIQIQSWKGHTDDHIHLKDDNDANGDALDYSYIDLPNFSTYEEAIKDFVKQKIFDNNTKTFWEVQEEREWLD